MCCLAHLSLPQGGPVADAEGDPQMSPGFQECRLHDSHFAVSAGMVLSQRELPCPRFHSPPKGNLSPKTHSVGRQQPSPRPRFGTPLNGRPTFTAPRGWPRSLLPSPSCCSVSFLTQSCIPHSLPSAGADSTSPPQ